MLESAWAPSSREDVEAKLAAVFADATGVSLASFRIELETAERPDGFMAISTSAARKIQTELLVLFFILKDPMGS